MLRIHPTTGIQLKNLQLCFHKPTFSFELPENETTCPKVPQLNPELAMAWQSKEHSWAVEESPAGPRAQRVVPVVHPALSHGASGLPPSRETLPELPQLCPPSASCPGHGHVLHAPTFLPSCPGAKTQCKGRTGETRVCKGEGKNDPTLPHPILESRNNSKTGERQSSKQHNTAPARGSQPALGLGEKELTAGAEQGWVS